MSLTGGNNSMGGEEGGRETEDTGPPVSTLLRECGGQRFKGGYSDYSVTINYTVTLLAGQICQKANPRLQKRPYKFTLNPVVILFSFGPFSLVILLKTERNKNLKNKKNFHMGIDKLSHFQTSKQNSPLLEGLLNRNRN